MSIYYYLNEDHTYEPCDFAKYQKQFHMMCSSVEGCNMKKVASDIIDGYDGSRYYISTMWVGMDHNHIRVILGENLGDRTLVFETMVFEFGIRRKTIYIRRYSTWYEAVEGHKDAIELFSTLMESSNKTLDNAENLP